MSSKIDVLMNAQVFAKIFRVYQASSRRIGYSSVAFEGKLRAFNPFARLVNELSINQSAQVQLDRERERVKSSHSLGSNFIW